MKKIISIIKKNPLFTLILVYLNVMFIMSIVNSQSYLTLTEIIIRNIVYSIIVILLNILIIILTIHRK